MFENKRVFNIRIIALFLCAILTVTVLAGCQGADDKEQGSLTSKYGGTIRVAMMTYPVTMDPFTGWELAGSVFVHVTEQLITYDEDWNIIPQLADEYFSDKDYTEWTFKLREGVLFHNGDEMTAEDVKASIKRWQETSSRASDLSTLERVDVIDKNTVKLIFSERTPLADVQLAYPQSGVHVMPKNVLEEVDDFIIPPDMIVGTGPYVLSEAVPDTYVRLTRFEDYKPDERFEDRSGYGGRKIAYADEILLIPVPDASMRTAGILAGDYDFAQDLPKLDYDIIDESSYAKPIINPAKFIPNMFFRNVEGSLFSDLNMRRAVQVALSMDEIMLAVAQREEFYRVDSSPFTEESVWHHPAGEITGLYNVNDIQKAKDYLKKAGYDGREITLITSIDYDWMYRAGIVIYEQLKEIGMNINFEVYDWATAESIRSNTEDWDLFIAGDSVLNHDGTFINYWHSDQGWLGYSNPEIDVIIEEGMQHSDFEVRYPIYCRLQEALYENATVILLGDLAELNATGLNLKGYKNHVNLRFFNVWKE